LSRLQNDICSGSLTAAPDLALFLLLAGLLRGLSRTKDGNRPGWQYSVYEGQFLTLHRAQTSTLTLGRDFLLGQVIKGMFSRVSGTFLEPFFMWQV